MTNADYEYWTTDVETRSKIPQSSDPKIMAAMIQLADIEPGMTVMEIGTGSGYTAAILADKVGPSGRVVSLDIDGKLTARASALHHRAGNAHVECHHIDGALGWERGAPYDRILGWTSPQILPKRWIQQSVQHGLIVTPINIAGLAGINAVIRCQVTNNEPGKTTLRQGNFIEMTDEPVVDFARSPSFADCIITAADNRQAWVSIGGPDKHQFAAESLIRQLVEAKSEPEWLALKDWQNFAAYIVGAKTICTRISLSTGTQLGIGLTDFRGTAVVLGNGSLITHGTTSATATLHRLRNAWEHAGKPGYESATVSFVADAEGWFPDVRISSAEVTTDDDR